MMPADQKGRVGRSVNALRGWPLWAKIVAPVGLLIVIGGVANAAPKHEKSISSAPLTTEATGFADLPTATDQAAVVNASTTATETTPAPTVAVTPPPTIAQTAPPTTEPPVVVTPAPTVPPTFAPVPPPTPPPTAAPTLPPVIEPIAEPATDPRFGTCKEAKANGYGPYRQGVDPEYAWYRDSDHDGVDCE